MAFVALLLCAGYAGSQWFALTGRASEWARIVDVPSVQGLAAALLLGLLVLGLVPGEKA